MTFDTVTVPEARSGLRYRPSIRELEKDSEAMERFVGAMRGMMEKPEGDETSYLHIAGIHGNPPPHKCDHRIGFFPWHRAYLLKLERALNLIEPGVALPWWDFASEDSRRDGVPTSYRHPDEGGVDVLHSSYIPYEDRHSTRNIQTAPSRLPNQAVVDSALGESNYVSMWRRYYPQVHNALHNWLGGDHAGQNWTAYDPIFWAFHCSNDRHWAIWQNDHPGAHPPHLDEALRGLDMTARDVLDINELGYEYATTEILVEPE